MTACCAMASSTDPGASVGRVNETTPNDPVAQRPPFAPGYTAGPDDPFEPARWSQIEQMLQKARNYWVITVRANGTPHAMPVWGLWFDQAVWFSTSPNAVKAKNLVQQPACVIHLESGDDAVIVEGTCAQVDVADARVTQFVDDYEVKYGFRVDTSEPDFAIFRMQPQKMLTWQESNFPASNTRWYFGS